MSGVHVEPPFVLQRHIWAIVMMIVLFAATAAVLNEEHLVSGQDADATPVDAGYPAVILRGPCNTLDPEVIAPLTGVSPHGGSDEHGWAFTSASVVDIPLDDLVSGQYSLAVTAVEAEASSGIALACGEVAGDAASGTAVIGLVSTGRGNLAGVAVLTDGGGNQTAVELYLILTGNGTTIGPGDDDDQDQDAVDDDTDDDQESTNPDV